MKAISLLVTLVFLFSLGTGVLAQETELPDPGLTPDSPFYFLETIAEGIGTFFTFGDLKKAERHAALAAERLAEAKAVVEKGKPELAEKTLARYEKQLNNSIDRAKKAQAKGKNAEKVTEVVAKIAQATSKHLEVLAEVYEKVPEQAKPAIENAMKVSVKGHEQAVEALKEKNALGEVPEKISLPAQVPAEVRERVQMRAQQELEIEKFISQISETPREACERSEGPPEICEKIPAKGFRSFAALEGFCTEAGGPPEICTTFESICKEFGITEPNQCFHAFTAVTKATFSTAEVKAYPARSSEEEIEERRQREEEGRTLKLQTPEGTIEIPTEGLEEGIIEVPGEEGRTIEIRRVGPEGKE